MRKNKIPLALITGGGHRLGRAFCLSLAQMGYAILIHYCNSESDAKRTGEEIRLMGVPVYFVQSDLTDSNGIESVLKTLETIPNSLSVLINSAGIMVKNTIRDVSMQEWDQVMNLNLRAPFFLARQVAEKMQEGLIVNISDAGTGKNWVSYPAYSVSKSALETATRILARALAPGIRVNAIAPGLVLPPTQFSPEVWKKLVDHLPARRAVEMKDITSSLEFLLRNKSITGQVITIDGGYSLL